MRCWKWADVPALRCRRTECFRSGKTGVDGVAPLTVRHLLPSLLNRNGWQLEGRFSLVNPLRKIILWTTLLGLALLTALSIIGAFLGDQRASLLFNSLPMAAFWVLLTLLLVAGLIFFERLRRSFGLLATHAGCLLLLVGSIIGSSTGHRVTGALSGRPKVPSGRMTIHEGAAESSLRAFGADDEIARLPFSVRLNDFSIEYYPLEDATWLLLAQAPPIEKDGAMMEQPPRTIEWAVGDQTAIPYTSARLKVLQYLPGSRPIYPEDVEPTLEITRADGQVTRIPAKVGQEAALVDPQVKLRIVQVFSNLRVEGSGAERQVIDVPGLAANPALKLEVEHPDGTVTHTYVMPNLPEQHHEQQKVNVRYLTASDPVAAEPDPQSSLPAMELLLKQGDKELRRWLIARPGAPYVSLSLTDLVADAECAEHGDMEESCCPEGEHDRSHASAAPTLYLVRPRGQISDYKSDLTVLEEGREVARKTIEVNDPLHYGGYHFYQSSYDQEHEHYTVLSVRSDSGLLAVYAGFLLVAVGVFWLFWVKPALAPPRALHV